MTNRAAIYRAGSRWPIVAAFTVAVAIHLSVVAIASLHREEPVVNPGNQIVTIEAEPGAESPAQPQEESPLNPPPPSEVSEDVIETSQPILKIRSNATIRVTKQTSAGFTLPRALTLHAPRPDYPYEARSRHLTGSGVAELTVDPATGLVEGVVMEQSIGHPILDHSAITAFRSWRFKPGAARKVRVPIRFLITGADY